VRRETALVNFPTPSRQSPWQARGTAEVLARFSRPRRGL